MSATILAKCFLDTFLILGFGVVHSALASFRSKELGKKLFPAHIYRLIFSLVTAFYILGAAHYWQQIPILIYSIPTPYCYISQTIVLLGWLMYFFSHLFYYEVGGVFGTSQIFAKSPLIQQARFDYSTNGLKSYIRFPVHTAFFFMFLAIPTMYLSTLIFALLASLYAWLGTIHHDHRYTKIFKKSYEDYKQNSGMVLPRFRNFKLSKYSVYLRDAAPRIQGLPLYILTTLVMVIIIFFIIINIGSDIADGQWSLLFIPLTLLFSSAIASIFSLIIIRQYHFTTDTSLNLKNSECVVFSCGCAIACTLGFAYFLIDYLYGQFPNFAAIIPTWVLSLLLMHVIYFFIEKLFLVWRKYATAIFN